MSCHSPVLIIGVVLLCANACRAALTFSCNEKNDLYQSVVKGGSRPQRFDDAAKAIAHAEAGGGVLVLADRYPAEPVRIGAKEVEAAREKRLRLYVEFPETFPGVEFAEPRTAVWERGVVASDGLAAPLSKLRILSAHGCTFLPVVRGGGCNSLLVLARVAGYDTAVYGLPPESFPLLFATADGHLVATTKLSGFVTGRYAPAAEWAALWRQILAKLDPEAEAPRLVIEPAVRASFGRDERLPPGAEAQALARYAAWLRRPGLLVAPARQEPLHDLLRRGVETTDPPRPDEPAGDGSLGILEGYASHVRPDGGQPRRLPLRADCHGEAAMVLALHALLENDPNSRALATNLLDFVYFNSGMHRGVFGDPSHPAFGHVAWGDVAPAWTVATYGDDNARALLGTVVAAACLGSDRWDEAALKGLLANLRTAGRLGFRGDRIDVPDLARNGWKHYHDADTVNPAANFEAYPWAAFLWAYRHTGEREFLDKARAGIGRMMEVYPRGWRWADNTERARMLLPLAWLVRVDDEPKHRQWLKTVATDLLKNQHACGAIREHLGGEGRGGGHYVVPASNEAYGTTETPLIQQNGDPVSDQLYNTGFALIGLHEAAAVTGDRELKEAADRLAAYHTRIQARSDAVPYLDGAWFRAFDYDKWECWASSADMGWGAWSVEAGWAPAWAATALGLRAKDTSLWELTAGSKIGQQLPAVRHAMAVNGVGPQQDPAQPTPAEQWIPLLNGKDLDGWTPKITGRDLGDNWNDTFRVENGVLRVAYDRYKDFGGHFGHLFYKDKFSHYRLRVEYRFVGTQTPGGPGWAVRNSGVMLHCQDPRTMTRDQEFPVSIEVQFLGGDGTRERHTANLCTPGTHVEIGGKLVTRHCTDSTSKTYHGDGWVTVEVEVRADEVVRHVVDGKVVLEYGKPQLDDNDADAKRLLEKGAPKAVKEGYIALQAESHPVEFRKVELLRLPN